MAEIDLTQDEADALIAMPKLKINDDVTYYPNPGGSQAIPLRSIDKTEDFLLDIKRGRIDLMKATYQNRARKTIVLMRLDLNGAPHRNPDGEEVASPHLHVYREGYGDKWAGPLPTDSFRDPADQWTALSDFMRYCNITQPPDIQKGIQEWKR
ncbi:MAG TPA: hypothetical protein PKG62_05680 [Methanothrix soehngenii]|nr:hypothetical protein [Methanothrix soehngenii]